MRLIDADRLKGTITGATPLKLWMKRTLAKAMDAMYETVEIIDGEPTVDAVPVIRCEDCAWYEEEDGVCGLRPWARMVKDPGGFCDEGRRSDEQSD